MALVVIVNYNGKVELLNYSAGSLNKKRIQNLGEERTYGG
jgi:hypothetical protein